MTSPARLMDGCELKILAMMKRRGEVINLTSGAFSIRALLNKATADVFAALAIVNTISWNWEVCAATHQGDVLILIGHEEKSPIVQDHAVHMLQRTGRKQTPFFLCVVFFEGASCVLPQSDEFRMIL